MIRHLRERYRYDAEQGVVRNRKGRVIKGFDDGRGYLYLNARVDGNRHVVELHQLVWALVYGKFPKQIDHINGNSKDNRVDNLREVTLSENCLNRLRPWKPNAKTGLPGVCKVKDGFEVKVGGKRYYFRDKYEAFYTLTMLGRMFREE